MVCWETVGEVGRGSLPRGNIKICIPCGQHLIEGVNLVAIGEFQFGEAEQVVGVADTLGGALGGQLAVLPQEGGQLELLG